MNAPDLLFAQTLLAEWTLAMTTPEAARLDVVIDAAHLVEAVTALSAARWGYLLTITGLDLGVAANQMETLYHFCNGSVTLTLRVRIPRAAPVLPTLCGVLPSASLFERELSEMLGITITNAPDTRRLYLPDDWPADVYPLRKDYVPESNEAPHAP